MLPTFSQNLTLEEAFETAAQINKELKRTELDDAFCQKFKLLMDRFSSFVFAKNIKSIEKMIHQKKNRGHQTKLSFCSLSHSSNQKSVCSIFEVTSLHTKVSPLHVRSN